jgi:hypothetical protein
MIPEVNKKINLWKPEVTSAKMKQMKLDHFLPPQTMRDQLV